MRTAFFVMAMSVLVFGWTQPDRKVAVLDLTTINGETNLSRLYGTTNALELAGIPYDTTSLLTTAFDYPVIMTGSRILQDVFNATERAQIENYVANGGVLITSSVRDTLFYNLCGISDVVSLDTLYEITWDTAAFPQYFDLIDDSLEVTISIGDSASPPSYFTRYYELNGSVSIGNYENGECALAYNASGFGYVYTFGPDFRDLSFRNQTDLDQSANRTYSNGFEPSTDVFVFLLRNIIREHIPNTVYKYTVPGTAESVLMVTHDIDSRTGIDTMAGFSSYEAAMGIKALYNITTRYFNDGWMTNFYVGAWSEMNSLINDGHTLASHSVGHFPDFADVSLFPYGTPGNTPGSYQPYYSGGMTTDGHVLGELEVSRDLLEGDFGIDVRTFRAGHLAYNDSLAKGLEEMGYEFNTTHSANNVLTGFPYYVTDVRSFSGVMGSILEIPMTISDVFSSDPITSANYPDKVTEWIDATNRYVANNANVVLLIHPNRMYKLNALQDYIAGLPSGTEFYGFEDFGDYWRKRDSLDFHTTLQGDTLRVYMDNDLLHAEQSFVVDTTGLDTVEFYDHLGAPLAMNTQPYRITQLLYYHDVVSGVVDREDDPVLTLYPNPVRNTLYVSIPEYVQNGQLRIYTLTGQLIYETTVSGTSFEINVKELGLSAGYYGFELHSGDRNYRNKVVITD